MNLFHLHYQIYEFADGRALRGISNIPNLGGNSLIYPCLTQKGKNKEGKTGLGAYYQIIIELIQKLQLL